jgi:hypothetical protein
VLIETGRYDEGLRRPGREGDLVKALPKDTGGPRAPRRPRVPPSLAWDSSRKPEQLLLASHEVLQDKTAVHATR